MFLSKMPCRWCFFVSLSLLLYSSIAIAQDAVLERHDAPTWEVLVPYVFGVVVAMIGAYVRGLSRRIENIERDINVKKADSNLQIAELKERMITRYHDIDAIERSIKSSLEPILVQIAHLQEGVSKVDAIHARLDLLRVPSANVKRGRLVAIDDFPDDGV